MSEISRMRYRHIPGDRKIHRLIESEIDNVLEAENEI